MYSVVQYEREQGHLVIWSIITRNATSDIAIACHVASLLTGEALFVFGLFCQKQGRLLVQIQMECSLSQWPCLQSGETRGILSTFIYFSFVTVISMQTACVNFATMVSLRHRSTLFKTSAKVLVWRHCHPFRRSQERWQSSWSDVHMTS